MIKQEIQDYYLWNTKKIQTAVSKPKNVKCGYIYWTKKDSKGRFQNALLDQIRIFDTRKILSRCANIDKIELKNIASKISVYILAE